MGDVLQYLIDGASGIVTGGVDGKALVAGICSKGIVGKGYLVGKRTDLAAMLGQGPLVERVRDILNTGGQEPFIVAVPVKGQPGGYITDVVARNTKIRPRVSGVPVKNVDITVKPFFPDSVIESFPASEERGSEIRLCWNTDGSNVYNDEELAYDGSEPVQLVIGEGESATGVTLTFPKLGAGEAIEEDAEWHVSARCAIGDVKRIGDEASPLVEIRAGSAGVLASAEIIIQIAKGGGRNEGTFQLSTDGGDNFASARTIPVNGIYELPDFGVSLEFPEGNYAAGTTYTCRLLAPAPSIVDVLEALETPLSLFDVEFVHVVGESDSVDWLACQAKAEELWNKQRPTYFKLEARLPYDNEDMSDYAAAMLAERQGVACRFVTVCGQYGEIVDATGAMRLRNAGALQSGRVMSVPVQRAPGRVKDGPVSQLVLPDGWEAIQTALEDAGFLTAKKYAGMEGAYWGDSRTLADETSDYRYEPVLRTTFKAVRITRIAALKSMYDEAGDPLRPNSENGLAWLKANLENALDTMVGANELAAYTVDIPAGQDITNNGVSVEITLIGIPIIRQIKLYNRYVYAGSKFDPRMEELA